MSWSLFGKKLSTGDKQRRRERRHHAGTQGQRILRFEDLEQRQMLAVITVTNLDDNTLPLLAGGGISLREALEAANTNASVDGSTAGSGADIIQFAPGLMGTITLKAASGQLPITESAAILGPGFDKVTINAD